MTNVYSFDGILVFGLLFICTCAYLKKVPRLNSWLLSEKKGVWGVFYKAAVIGTRLHIPVALSCLVMAFYIVFLKWWSYNRLQKTGWPQAGHGLICLVVVADPCLGPLQDCTMNEACGPVIKTEPVLPPSGGWVQHLFLSVCALQTWRESRICARQEKLMESACSQIRLFVFLLKDAKDGREVCALHHIHV